MMRITSTTIALLSTCLVFVAMSAPAIAQQHYNDTARSASDSFERAALGVILADGPQAPWITSVYVESPASEAGLRTGDQIVAINEQSCHTVLDVMRLIRAFRPGDSVTIEIWRDGEFQHHEATLASLDAIFAHSSESHRAFRPTLGPSTTSMEELKGRLDDLEAEVASLREQIAKLRLQLSANSDEPSKAPLGGGAIETDSLP